MKKNITMSDIAKRLGTSTVTVSKALADKEGVGQELREKVKQMADKMGYEYNGGIKTNREGGTYNVGVIIANRYIEKDVKSFYWDIYQEIVKQLIKYNYYAVLEILGREDEVMCNLPSLLQDGKIDGIIIVGGLKEAYLEKILNQNVPIVGIDFYDNKLKMDTVINDNVYGACVLTNYLIEKGHKNIGYVGNIHVIGNILDRYLGYYKALVENGLEVNSEWLISDRDEYGQYCEFELNGQLPTAFICNCDEVAYYFIKKLQSEGIRVPEDISVVGFDNYIYASLSQPAITTIEVDVQEMVTVAVDAIINKINTKDYVLGRKVMMGKLIRRESVKELS